MSFNEWDKVYSKKEMAKYPDNMLVRFIATNYYDAPVRKDVKFLDVGCGGGSSTWYLAREGFSVAAIDGSAVAMERLRVRLKEENLEAFLGCGDITKLDFRPDYFDCIIDVSSLCYIQRDEIAGIMKKLHTVLKPGGRFFSIIPTDKCAKPPFNHTIDGVNLRARFQSYLEAAENFTGFYDLSLDPYSYVVRNQEGSQTIHLWVATGVKNKGFINPESEKEALVSGEQSVITPNVKLEPFTSNKRGNYRFKTLIGDVDIEDDQQSLDKE